MQTSKKKVSPVFILLGAIAAAYLGYLVNGAWKTDMNINDFIEQICLGELRNLYLGEQGQVELSAMRRRKIIAYVNQGLKTLCSRFQLVKKELIIRGQDHVSLYPLRKEHSMSAGSSKLKFIDVGIINKIDPL